MILIFTKFSKYFRKLASFLLLHFTFLESKILFFSGKPCSSHQHLMLKNSQLRGMIKATTDSNGLYKCFSHWSLLSLDFLVSCMKMDPQYRLTSEELLKHNYFTHDRFPQRFLPALREKIHQEFNSNPLLRRYKADILLSTDRKDEYKQRRSLQTEPCRWKLNLAEGSIKRKFSCDTGNGDNVNNNVDKNLIATLTKTNQKLNAIQKSGQFLKQSSSSLREKLKNNKIGQSADIVKQIDIQKLEKSLESLTRLTQKCDTIRPSSVQKNKSSSPLTNQPSSPPQFQSLQPGINDFINHKSPQQSQTILHPSINNITFKEPPKKSPNLLQSLSTTSIKSTFNQVPLINPPKATQQFLKKLDRNVITIENNMHVEPFGNNSLINGPSWLNGNVKRRDKLKSDDFTLPNLPGGN